MPESGTSLFVMLRNVLFDDQQQSAYLADPTGYLAAHGYDELDHDDVAEAMTLLADTLPPDQAALVSSAVSGTASSSPAGDLSPVGQAAFTINHVVDTVRDGPETGPATTHASADPDALDTALHPAHASADPGALDTGLDEAVSSAPATAAFAAGPGDVGVDSVVPLGPVADAPPLAELDELSAFAAPDSLLHGDPVDALLEDPALGFDEPGVDDGVVDLGQADDAFTAPATFDLVEPDATFPPVDGAGLEADLTDVGLDVTGAPVGMLEPDRPTDLLDEDGF